MAYGGLNKLMDAAAELGRNPVKKHRIQTMEMSTLTQAAVPNPSRETKFSGANGNKYIFIFPIRLTTSRIGNLTRLILTLKLCVPCISRI